MTQGLELRGAVLGKGYRLGRRLDDLDDTLFEATHERIPGRFVVRLFPVDTLVQPEAASRIQRGARVASLLRDPHAIQVLDCNASGEVPAFVVIERVQGQSLAAVMAEDGMLALPRVADLVESLAAALAAGHQIGLVHGDLRPAHVILPASGQPAAKLSGFGWAKELRAAARLPVPSGYLAPEQQFGKVLALDERADQFGLAALAYEMIAACLPFSEESADLAEMMGQRRTPPAIADLVPGVPATLDEVLRRALSFTPSDRFDGVREFAARLSQVAAAQSQSTEQVPAASPSAGLATMYGAAYGATPGKPSSDVTEELDLATLTTYPVDEEEPTDDAKLVLGPGSGPVAADDAKTPVGSPFGRDGLDGPVPELNQAHPREEEGPVAPKRRFPTGRPSGAVGILESQSSRPFTLPPPDSTSRPWVNEPSAGNPLSRLWGEVRQRRKWTFPAATGVALLLIVAVMISMSGRSETSSVRGTTRGNGQQDSREGTPAVATTVQVEPLPPAASPHPTAGDGRAIYASRGQTNQRTIRPGSAYGLAPVTTRPFANSPDDCSLGITSKPWAQVWIDGRNTGRKTPIDNLKVACGMRKLTLKRPDQDLERVVVLKVVPGSLYRADYDLRQP